MLVFSTKFVKEQVAGVGRVTYNHGNSTGETMP